MAPEPAREREDRSRRRARRRTLRARVIAAIAVVAVAHWTHAAGGAVVTAPLHADARESDGSPREAGPSGAVGGAAPGSAEGQRALPPHAEPRREATPAGGWTDAVRMGAALAVVVGLLGAAWWWLRRNGVGGGSAAGAFEVLARHPVGRGQQIVVARFGPRVLCLQQTREGLRTLSEVADPTGVERVLEESGSRPASRALPRVEATRPEPIRTVDLRAGARA
jgi:flagellar biogenesis protein FliO